LGTEPVTQAPEVYRPPQRSPGGSFSLTGVRKDQVQKPTHVPYRPPVARDLLPPIPDDLLDYLREHLLAGETHYTTRPGMVELRGRVAEELARSGGPDVGAEGVVITAGEGEALFTALLGLGIEEGSAVRLSGAWQRHTELLDILGVDGMEPSVDGGPADIACLGFTLGHGGASVPNAGEETIVIGSLEALPAMLPFRLGFAAGRPERIRRVMTWKQALSICSAAPSQRAALYAFEQQDAGTDGSEVAS
jgi:aspartate/methionine/tyrosine aminotransferase